MLRRACHQYWIPMACPEMSIHQRPAARKRLQLPLPSGEGWGEGGALLHVRLPARRRIEVLPASPRTPAPPPPSAPGRVLPAGSRRGRGSERAGLVLREESQWLASCRDGNPRGEQLRGEHIQDFGFVSHQCLPFGGPIPPGGRPSDTLVTFLSLPLPLVPESR